MPLLVQRLGLTQTQRSPRFGESGPHVGGGSSEQAENSACGERGCTRASFEFHLRGDYVQTTTSCRRRESDLTRIGYLRHFGHRRHACRARPGTIFGRHQRRNHGYGLPHRSSRLERAEPDHDGRCSAPRAVEHDQHRECAEPDAAVRARSTQFDSGIQTGATLSLGIGSVNLRGIGTNRTLVLVDGRRAQPANAALIVDTNTIPSAAIERVETITGGASAVYGADALAGVVNFILKKDFEGVDMDFQATTTQQGDGEEYRGTALLGVTPPTRRAT